MSKKLGVLPFNLFLRSGWGILSLAIRPGAATKAVVENEHQFGSVAELAAAASATNNSSCLLTQASQSQDIQCGNSTWSDMGMNKHFVKDPLVGLEILVSLVRQKITTFHLF